MPVYLRGRDGFPKDGSQSGAQVSAYFCFYMQGKIKTTTSPLGLTTRRITSLIKSFGPGSHLLLVNLRAKILVRKLFFFFFFLRTEVWGYRVPEK